MERGIEEWKNILIVDDNPGDIRLISGLIPEFP